MVQQLHIRAAQASALLTTNKRYLSHIFIHGVKGSYETMNNWLSILLNNIDEIAALLLKDVYDVYNWATSQPKRKKKNTTLYGQSISKSKYTY